MCDKCKNCDCCSIKLECDHVEERVPTILYSEKTLEPYKKFICIKCGEIRLEE